MAFKVTTSGNYLYGYYLWRADSGQPATADFALWTITGATTGTLVASSHASIAGDDHRGMDYVALGTPIALTLGHLLQGGVRLHRQLCDTQDSSRAPTPMRAGIVNGPLTAFSDLTGVGGTNAEPEWHNSRAVRHLGRRPDRELPDQR